jgi:hypothetical protein
VKYKISKRTEENVRGVMNPSVQQMTGHLEAGEQETSEIQDI